MNPQEEFWRLCNEVVVALDQSQDYRLTEPSLLKILDLVKANPKERQFFVDAFIAILENPRKWRILIVEFCMRELKYPEVYQKAMEIDKTFKGVSGDMDAYSVLQVYGKVWPTGRIFEYYKHKEPPIQPMAIRYGRTKHFYHRMKGIIRRLFLRPRE